MGRTSVSSEEETDPLLEVADHHSLESILALACEEVWELRESRFPFQFHQGSINESNTLGER
jgi:hypothetical protein